MPRSRPSSLPRRGGRPDGRYARLLLFALLALFVAGCDRLTRSGSASASASASAALVPVAPLSAAPEPVRALVVDGGGRPITFAPLVERADPSVSTVKAIVKRGGREAEGLGTAFVYDSGGLLLTNHHVVDKASELIVGFRDGREYPAEVVGADKRTDVAVLRIGEKGLPALPLGNSDAIQVGDWVLAIGNPFGLAHTVSAGILSARGRTRDDVKGLDDTGYYDFLQTDASINPGNSGGPLLNMQGEVVGINAAIRQNANNIAFTIPINMVKDLLPVLIRDGKVKRSAIGVVVADVTQEQATRLHRPNRKGAWVKAVQGGGPADKAGVVVDDIILNFDGKDVPDPNALRWFASISGVGKPANLRIVRDGKEFELKVTLGELPD